MAINRFSKIQTLPDWKPAIPAELLISGLKYKEELFAKNRNALSTTIGQLGTVDDMILNKKTKDQFNKDLDLAVKNINANYAFADLAKSSVLNQAFGTFNTIASNPDYISRLKESNEIRNELQKKEAFREKGEKYSDVNDAVFSYHVNKYIEADPQDAARLSRNAIYTPYEDDKKWADETIKAMENDENIKVSYSKDGLTMITTTDKSKTPMQVGQYLQALMPDPIKKQLSINAEYEYIKSKDDQSALQTAYTKYGQDLDRELREVQFQIKDNALKVAEINGFTPNKAELEEANRKLGASLATKEAELKSKIEEHNRKVSQSQYTQDDIKSIVSQNYVTDWMNYMMGSLRTDKVQVKVELNPIEAFKRELQIKYDQLEQAKESNRLKKEENTLKKIELGVLPMPEEVGMGTMVPLGTRTVTDPTQQLIEREEIKANLEQKAFGFLTPGSTEWAKIQQNLTPAQAAQYRQAQELDKKEGGSTHQQEFITAALRGMYKQIESAKPGQKVNIPVYVKEMFNQRQIAINQLRQFERQDEEFATKAVKALNGVDYKSKGLTALDVYQALNALKLEVTPGKVGNIDELDQEEFTDLVFAIQEKTGKKFYKTPLNYDLTVSWDPRVDKNAVGIGPPPFGKRVRDQRDINDEDRRRADLFIRKLGGAQNAHKVMTSILKLTEKNGTPGETLSMLRSNAFEDLYEDYSKGKTSITAPQSYATSTMGFTANTKIGELWSNKHFEEAFSIYASAVGMVGNKKDFTILDLDPTRSTVTIAYNGSEKELPTIIAAAERERGAGKVISVQGNKIELKVSGAQKTLSATMDVLAEQSAIEPTTGGTYFIPTIANSRGLNYRVDYKITPTQFGTDLTFKVGGDREVTLPELASVLPANEQSKLLSLQIYNQMGKSVPEISLAFKTLLNNGNAEQIDLLIKAINLYK
jgi:hypothetical protein